MKLAITGKGGVGKTTLASTLARLYADEGRPVLAADVDPDANLGLALGMSQEEVDSIVPISKMRTLVEERTGANEANKFFKLNPFVSDIPEKYAHEVNGVKLLVMGTVDTGGSGCVCPEHVMLKALLSALTYRKETSSSWIWRQGWSTLAAARQPTWISSSLWWSRAHAASRPMET